MNTNLSFPEFDWTLMRSFIAVIDEGSLQAAARRLNSSQPTIGRHIASLELQLGCALFERTGRQLIPTQVALVIVEHARLMEGSANAIGRVLTARDEKTTGTVRITASQSAACNLLPPILKRLREQEPGIAIELVASNQINNLLRREADIAVRMVRPEQDSLITRHIRDFAIGAYAHRNYLQKRGEPKTAQELIGHDLLGFDTDDSMLRGFGALGIEVDKSMFCFRSDDHMALLHAIHAGMGIGFAADYVCWQEPNLQRVLPNLKIATLPVWLTVHREVHGNQKIRIVYDFLAQAIAEVTEE